MRFFGIALFRRHSSNCACNAGGILSMSSSPYRDNFTNIVWYTEGQPKISARLVKSFFLIYRYIKWVGSNFSISLGVSLRAKRSNLVHSKEIVSSLRLLAMTGCANDSVLPRLIEKLQCPFCRYDYRPLQAFRNTKWYNQYSPTCRFLWKWRIFPS